MVTCQEKADLLALLYVVFSYANVTFPNVLIHLRTKGEIGTVNMLKPSSILLTVPRRCFFCRSFFLFVFVFVYNILSVPCSLVIPAGKGLTAWFFCV